MHRHHPLIALSVLVIAGSILAGCSEDAPVAPQTSDEQYFKTVVSGRDNETQDLIGSDIEALDESEDVDIFGADLPKMAADSGLMPPFRFGRRITAVDRSISGTTTMYGDSVAIVHTETHITGEFIVRGRTAGGHTTVRKPFTETVHRNLRFERDMRSILKNPYKWKLVAASVVNGGTAPPASAILSIDLITRTDTLTVTNPDEYYMATKDAWRIRMPRLKERNIVLRVTVSSSDADTEIVTLNHLVSSDGMRKQMMPLLSQSGGAGSFTRVYELHWMSKLRHDRKFGHLVISVFPHRALYDADPNHYASTIWGIPYLPSE